MNIEKVSNGLDEVKQLRQSIQIMRRQLNDTCSIQVATDIRE
jgi:hypothetical protein